MSFPTTAIPTTNLNSSSADPSQARADLLQAVTELNTIKSEKNTADGVLVLDGNGLVRANQLPNTYSTTSQLTLSAGDNVVKIEVIARLQQIGKDSLVSLTNAIPGDIVLCSNADTGPNLCIFDGTNWKYMPLASWTTVV